MSAEINVSADLYASPERVQVAEHTPEAPILGAVVRVEEALRAFKLGHARVLGPV